MNLETLKLNRSRNLIIRSRDRTNIKTTSSSDFSISFDTNEKGIGHCKGFIIGDCSFPQILKTVSSPLNFSLEWESGVLPSIEIDIVIPVDNYNTTELAAVLQNLISTELKTNDVLYDITVIYNVDDRFVFTSTGATAGTIKISHQDQDTNDLLGIGGQQEELSFVSPNTLLNMSNLFGNKNIHITSKTLSDNNTTLRSDNKFSPMICHVPVKVAYGEYQIYGVDNIETNSIIFPVPKNISEIDIQVRDDNGIIQDFQGVNWQMRIKIYY